MSFVDTLTGDRGQSTFTYEILNKSFIKDKIHVITLDEGFLQITAQRGIFLLSTKFTRVTILHVAEAYLL